MADNGRYLLPLLFVGLVAQAETGAPAEAWTPAATLKEALKANPGLMAQKAEKESAQAAVLSKYSLDNPRVGLMQEPANMQSWTLSQEVMFPTKYISMGSMQRSKARMVKEEYNDKQWEVRQKALTQYYNLYTKQRISALLLAQKETLREISRVVEARRATGAVPQQDEMKAHVEQTKIESEILLMNQEVTEAQASLNELLNRTPEAEFDLPGKDFAVPQIQKSERQILELAPQNSKIIAAQSAARDEAQSAKNLAMMSYLPDFMFSYKKPYGPNAPANDSTFGVEMTIPLWFFTKQISEVSAASAKVRAADSHLLQTRREVDARAKTLYSKSKTLADLIKIHQTALIPQATSALNSSRAAYGAGRVGFQELLDAERSLYSVRMDYYRNLARYVDALSDLERTVGVPISDLPFEGDLHE